MKPTKRDIILSTSAKLFRERGYSATSMRDIANAVGIKAASLYNHISSKQDILKDLLMHIANSFVDGITEIEASSASPAEKIDAIIKLHVHITTKDYDAIALITHDWRHLEEPTLSTFSNMRTSYEQRLKNIIEEGIALGELRTVNAEIALFSILSTMRWLYSWYGKNDALSPEELQQQLSICLIKGLM